MTDYIFVRLHRKAEVSGLKSKVEARGKFQIPNSNIQRSSKFQASAERMCGWTPDVRTPLRLNRRIKLQIENFQFSIFNFCKAVVAFPWESSVARPHETARESREASGVRRIPALLLHVVASKRKSAGIRRTPDASRGLRPDRISVHCGSRGDRLPPHPIGAGEFAAGRMERPRGTGGVETGQRRAGDCRRCTAGHARRWQHLRSIYEDALSDDHCADDNQSLADRNSYAEQAILGTRLAAKTAHLGLLPTLAGRRTTAEGMVVEFLAGQWLAT